MGEPPKSVYVSMIEGRSYLILTLAKLLYITVCLPHELAHGAHRRISA